MYKIKKIRRGWIVVNTRTGNHAHFRSEYGCHCILLFIRENIMPDNNYLKESYKRLTIDNKEQKQKYYNVNKGVRV